MLLIPVARVHGQCTASPTDTHCQISAEVAGTESQDSTPLFRPSESTSAYPPLSLSSSLLSCLSVQLWQ